jgi:hypothetical protein
MCGVVAHIYNLSTWEVMAGGSQVQGQPGLHTETFSKIQEKKERKEIHQTLFEK